MKLQYLHEEFDYTELAKRKWSELLSDTMDKTKIHFDTENNGEMTKTERVITIDREKNEDMDPVKFRCQMWSAGGDWQQMSYYFRCQITNGFAYYPEMDEELSQYGNSMFCMIPPKDGGNEHLIAKDGKFFPPDDPYPNDPETEPNESKCWEWLKGRLDEMVRDWEKGIE